MLSVSALVLSRSTLARAQASPAAAAQTSAPTPAQPAGAPVEVGGKTLFYVPARMFTFSPAERATAIAGRVNWLSRQSAERINQLQIEDAETSTAIVSGDVTIATITDSDAKALGKTRQALAQQYMQAIKESALALRDQYSLRTILLGILYLFLATAVLIAALKALKRIFLKVYALLEKWHGLHIRSIRLQKLELVSAERISGFLYTLSQLLRLLTTLLLIYAYVAVVTSFFPWTRGYSGVLLNDFLVPLKVVWAQVTGYLPNLFFLVVIFVAAYYAGKFVKFFFREIGRGTISVPGFYAEWSMPTYKIARALIVIFTLIVAFPYLPGSTSPAFQGVSIFFGLLLSLGSSSAISNVVAGTVLTYTRAFQLGDRVQIGDTTGDVVEKTLLITRVRTIKNVDVAVPNAMVLTSHIINFSAVAKQTGLVLHTSVTIGYNAPWRKIHELLIAAAESTANILREPKPYVLQTALNDFYVSYEINAFTDRADLMAQTYSDLHQNIQDKFYEAGVEIMSPHYFGVRDGNGVAIPDQYLPKGYAAPSFRVSATGNREGLPKQ